LPPYCPDLNPIEESFSKVKSVLKANEEALFNMGTETAVLTAFNTITPHDCMQWIKHAGYDEYPDYIIMYMYGYHGYILYV